jgi:ABC-type glycerol-3-phosphate transport system substrate-binding protein
MQSGFRVVMTALTLVWCLCFGCVELNAQDDLIGKAQNERELILNGTALVGQFEKFAEPFKRRYPFIKVQYARTTGEALTTKILREAAARQLSVDVILINNYTHRIFMKKNLLTPYAPPGAANFPQGFVDKQAYWVLSRAVRHHVQHQARRQNQRAEIVRRPLAAKMEGADLTRT